MSYFDISLKAEFDFQTVCKMIKKCVEEQTGKEVKKVILKTKEQASSGGWGREIIFDKAEVEFFDVPYKK